MCFAKVGESISDTGTRPINHFRTHLTGHFPDNVCMQPTYRLEIIIVTKNKSSEITTPLENIIHFSFVTGSVPVNPKIAQIIPIFKSGNNQLFNDYRPIIVLPTSSKIMGKLVCWRNRLSSFFDKYSILHIV